jgi:hypothetical protein
MKTRQDASITPKTNRSTFSAEISLLPSPDQAQAANKPKFDGPLISFGKPEDHGPRLSPD